MLNDRCLIPRNNRSVDANYSLGKEMVRYITDELRQGFRMIPLIIRDPDFAATRFYEIDRSNKTPRFEVFVLFLVFCLIAS